MKNFIYHYGDGRTIRHGKMISSNSIRKELKGSKTVKISKIIGYEYNYDIKDYEPITKFISLLSLN